MLGILRSAQGMKTVATILMGLALVTIAAVHVSSQKSVAIQGPGAMQAVSPERVWLGVNTDLWILDASGHKLAQKSAEDFGFKEAISNIALAPNGEALLTTRGDPTWKVVRVSDLSVVRTITPQWPEEFKGNVSRAIHVAVSPTWDIAVATGGGHTVLLFGSDGKPKARTPNGEYYFTNGLWHSPHGWWTTDTNNYALRLLDSETLVGKCTNGGKSETPSEIAIDGSYGGEAYAARARMKTDMDGQAMIVVISVNGRFDGACHGDEEQHGESAK